MRPKFLDNFPFLDLELASKTSRKLVKSIMHFYIIFYFYRIIYIFKFTFISYLYRGSRPVTASSKLPTNTKTVAIDLLPWQNQLIENGDPKIEVSFVLSIFLSLLRNMFLYRPNGLSKILCIVLSVNHVKRIIIISLVIILVL